MNELPVFATVGKTFGFVVERRFFSLLRLIWLPTLLSVVVGLVPLIYQVEVYGLSPSEKQLETLDNDGLFLGLDILNIIVSTILGAMIAISVHRMILLDDRQEGAYFYWRLTREEWLYVLAWIGYSILTLIALALPFVAHAAAVEYWGVHSPVNYRTVDWTTWPLLFRDDPRLLVLLALGVVFVLIALARFGLVFPIIVAEGRLSFARSWSVTRGNTLRLIGFWIVLTALAYVFIAVFVGVFAAAVVGMFGSVMFGGQNLGALGIVTLAVPAAVSIAVWLVVGVTLFIAGMSYSYAAITDYETIKTDLPPAF